MFIFFHIVHCGRSVITLLNFKPTMQLWYHWKTWTSFIDWKHHVKTLILGISKNYFHKKSLREAITYKSFLYCFQKSFLALYPSNFCVTLVTLEYFPLVFCCSYYFRKNGSNACTISQKCTKIVLVKLSCKPLWFYCLKEHVVCICLCILP